jgi:predicted nucleotidyltransferase
MKAVGVIVEYNPFHHGHAYHLQKAKERTGADLVIAAMSGDFLQRGEPALVSKWKRTEMALKGGVDLVFELPYAFAVQKADTFASGAVSLLAYAGCEVICFGSESGDIQQFYNTYSLLNKEEHSYNKYIKEFMTEGHSYPKSMSLAFERIKYKENVIDLSQPNNILGYQYVKAAEEQEKRIQMLTITRKNAQYHDQDFSSSTIASATSIRKALFSHQLSSIQAYVPSHTYELLLQYQQQFGSFHRWDMYWPYLKFCLMQMNSNQLADIYEVEEGIENRILRLAIKSENFLQFMNELKTKRYTWTRLQRTLTHILTHTTKQEMQMNEEKVSYLRLLGMTEQGRLYLNKLKKECAVPIISKRSALNHPQLEIDSKAARIYAMGLPENERQLAINLEYAQQPIYLKNKAAK